MGRKVSQEVASREELQAWLEALSLDRMAGHIPSVDFVKECWRPEEKVPPDICSPQRSGYCYLVLVRPDARAKCAAALGRNPYMLSVFAWLQENISVWSSDRFMLSYGLEPLGGDGRHYVQAHVAASVHGLTHKELLPHSAFGVRLGAEVLVPTQDQVGSAAGGSMRVSAPSVSPVVRIPWVVVLKHTSGRCSFSPRTNADVLALTKYYESAEIVSLSATLTITGGEQVCVSVGCGTGAVAPNSVEGFLSLPVCSVFSGSADSNAVAVFELPRDHGFGREVKAVSVGNPDPVLHFFVDPGTAAVVMVRGTLELRVGGVGVPTPFILTTSK